MIYNAVESSIRAVLTDLRMQIQRENVVYNQVKDFWQIDYIQSEFLDKMQSGTSHGQLLIDIAPKWMTALAWSPTKVGRMPSSGNFGQDSAIALKTGLPLRWSPPPDSGGGIDLELVRTRRNQLSHGLEEYEIIGSSTTTADLLKVSGRVEIYMASLIEAVEQYQARREYLR